MNNKSNQTIPMLNDRLVSTCIVTVTYGDRKHLLEQMIEGGLGQGLTRFVVVNNGAQWDVSELKLMFPDLDLEIVDMGSNKGSAAGFAAGIQRAYDLGVEYIWLMDDDNCPQIGCLDELLHVYARESQTTPADRLAVLAFRPEHQADVAMGVATHRINPRANSFRGFHVLDIPYKIWRRTPWGKPRVRGALPATVALDMAPYSGLLFHRDLIQSIGLPNADFVLYADDSEFTYRIAKKGGRTLLVTAAMIDDLESSWNIKARFGNSFIGNLKGADDFRAYYSMRNGVYLDTISMRKSGFVFWVNRVVYMMFLFLFSIALGKRERYHLLREAVDDGLSGRLGVNKAFPL